MTDHTFIQFVESKTEDIVSFGGGTVLSLIAWLYISLELLVGKLLMIFVVGVVGGIGGITAKVICNYTTRKFKAWWKVRNLKK